jgi:hypothetical protein
VTLADRFGERILGRLPNERGSVIPKYEIRVRGRLSKSLASEFERLDLAVSELRVETVLNGSFEDQAALYGILRQIEGLGLELIDVHRMP